MFPMASKTLRILPKVDYIANSDPVIMTQPSE